MEISKQNQSELAKAKVMLQGLHEKLRQIRAAMAEKKDEALEIDQRHHTLEATGDINRMIEVKSHSVTLKKAIAVMMSSEVECLERIKSIERYVETLTKRLEGLRREAASVAEKLADDGLAPEVAAGLKTAMRRIEMQIESLAGREGIGAA
jgi:hypothetical protein